MIKTLVLALLALFVVHRTIHRKAPQRSPQAAAAWADWFEAHPNGGGV